MEWKRSWMGEQAEVVWMSPAEFLAQCPAPHTSTMSADKAEVSDFCEGSLTFRQNQILDSEPIYMPTLDKYNSKFHGFYGHDGRHLAKACQLAGVDSIPIDIRDRY